VRALGWPRDAEAQATLAADECRSGTTAPDHVAGPRRTNSPPTGSGIDAGPAQRVDQLLTARQCSAYLGTPCLRPSCSSCPGWAQQPLRALGGLYLALGYRIHDTPLVCTSRPARLCFPCRSGIFSVSQAHVWQCTPCDVGVERLLEASQNEINGATRPPGCPSRRTRHASRRPCIVLGLVLGPGDSGFESTTSIRAMDRIRGGLRSRRTSHFPAIRRSRGRVLSVGFGRKLVSDCEFVLLSMSRAHLFQSAHWLQLPSAPTQTASSAARALLGGAPRQDSARGRRSTVIGPLPKTLSHGDRAGILHLLDYISNAYALVQQESICPKKTK